MQKKPVKAVKIGPWPEGMDNRLPTQSVPINVLRNAVNVDIDNTGRVRSRKPVTKLYNGLGTHSLFSCPIGTFFVEGTDLKVLNSNNTATTIYTNVAGKLAYEFFNDYVYFSDGAVLKRIDSSFVISNLGITVDTTITVTAGDKVVSVDIHNPMPAGNIIRFYRGRLYIVSGKNVWYSEPYTYDRTKLYDNYMQWPSDISVFEPVSNGIWLVSDKTYFLQGNTPSEFNTLTQLDYGAIPGTGTKVPNSNDVMWMSQRGVCLGDQDGTVTNLQEKHVAINPGLTGTSIVREHDGLKQFIGSYTPSGTTTLASSDWMAFEALRKA